MRRWLLLLVILIACVQIGDAPAPRVQLIGVRPYLTDKEPLAFEVRVPRHAENRRLIVAAFADGEADPVSSGTYDLDLADPPLRDVTWYLGPGVYVIVAAVFGETKELGRDQKPVTVRGKFD